MFLTMIPIIANPQVGDGADGKLVHLDGLNFSRAWGLYRIANRLGGEEGERFSRFTKSLVISSSLDFGLLISRLRLMGDTHVRASFDHVVGSNYMGSHW